MVSDCSSAPPFWTARTRRLVYSDCALHEARKPGTMARKRSDMTTAGPEKIEELNRHCQVADERAFFSLGAERPSLGQQAHVTSSH